MESERASHSPPPGGSHDVRNHRIRKLIDAIICGILLVAAWVIVGIFLYVVPAVDAPERSDAIVVLAPPIDTGRLEYAEILMSEGYATTLVVSLPEHVSGQSPTDICSANRPYRVICFSPDPVTTQGEAKAIKRLSEQYAWQSITVVTDDFHVARSRTLIERCYPKQLYMAAVRNDRSLTDWAYRYVYESAALVKAAVDWGC
ncbi:uncharacterized SAM-binding protein YcdF (DUF218 family) [Pseudarthrobacter siccitolerans]|uniref:Uncharacterized SAM-binding protein YcdF (DUF218 family) n=1 Tax=Pseudarthrobacter siccitolerans TaxID=861266 RepID=A0ABU0PJ23_9MICC|nr:uncharacterized SAM-binding protein YcdF (DUF218 family) [Pseudarthrobacter siccitolerans]